MLSKIHHIQSPKLAIQAGRGLTLPKAIFPNNNNKLRSRELVELFGGSDEHAKRKLYLIIRCSLQKKESTANLVITRAPVASQVLGSTPSGSELPKI
jgi:hypothetical protein